MFAKKELERLDKIVSEVKRDMDLVGIPYSKVKVVLDSKLKKTLGSCHYDDDLNPILIKISYRLFNNAPTQAIKNVICHELIHSGVGYKFNHDGDWKMYSEKMNNAENYYKIQVHDNEYIKYTAMYEIICSSCGNKTYRFRKNEEVKNPEFYVCCKCDHNMSDATITKIN